jgi:acyl-CoA thioester hydrolase
MTETARRREAAAALPSHRYALRVYYEDTDAGGIVYHANYLRFAERARTEMMRDAGVPHAAMVARDGVMFAVSRCEIEYLRPARLDDLLDVETRLVEVGGATVELEQIIRRDGTDLARIRIRLACLDATGRPCRVPAEVRAAMGQAAVRPLS